MSVERTNVPCGSCRACCRRDGIVLYPEHGDEPALYETVTEIHPLTGRPTLMLARKRNGDCLYLGDTGCTIHDRAPAICREFDCRRNYLQFSRAERKQLIRAGLMSKEVFAAGRARLDSLATSP
jgi:Fe-S-cluster containining protein